MPETYSHQYHNVNLDRFEVIDFREISEDVRKFFKFSNEKYVLTDKIVRIIEPKKSYSILDVGCGEGYVMRRIYKQVKRCVALDPDSKMLEILRKHVKNNPKVVFVNKKLEDFETTEKFDVTLSSHTLSFFSDKRYAINKMLDYTKKDGKLILVLHCRESEQLQMLKEVFRLTHGEEINHIYAEALCRYLVKQGFNPYLEKVETVSRFPSLEIALKFSYFLFRTDYQRVNSQGERVIRTYLESKMRNHNVEIRTHHGIISLKNNAFY